MAKGNGEAADSKTLEEIMRATWDETMGDDRDELPDGHEHLGAPNDEQEDVDAQDDTSSTPENDEESAEDDSDDAGAQDESADEETSAQGDDEKSGSDRVQEAPEHWSQEDRTMFAKLGDEAKEFLLRRHKQMEGDYTRKTQENAEAIKVGKLLDEAMDPAVKADLNRIGVDKEGYIRQMMQWHHMSVTDPVEFARNVVKQLRLDPAQVFGLKPGEKEPEKEPDPTTQRLAAVEQHLNSEQQARYRKAVQETQARVDAFKDEKDDQGNLKHPHFEAVRKVWHSSSRWTRTCRCKMRTKQQFSVIRNSARL